MPTKAGDTKKTKKKKKKNKQKKKKKFPHNPVETSVSVQIFQYPRIPHVKGEGTDEPGHTRTLVLIRTSNAQIANKPQRKNTYYSRAV